MCPSKSSRPSPYQESMILYLAYLNECFLFGSTLYVLPLLVPSMPPFYPYKTIYKLKNEEKMSYISKINKNINGLKTIKFPFSKFILKVTKNQNSRVLTCRRRHFLARRRAKATDPGLLC